MLAYVRVTPFTGVWIETQERIVLLFRFRVTPFTGVWIETIKRKNATDRVGHALHGRVD